MLSATLLLLNIVASPRFNRGTFISLLSNFSQRSQRLSDAAFYSVNSLRTLREKSSIELLNVERSVVPIESGSKDVKEDLKKIFFPTLKNINGY